MYCAYLVPIITECLSCISQALSLSRRRHPAFHFTHTHDVLQRTNINETIMSSQKTDLIYTEAVLQDREEKKSLVVDTISSHCVESSPFEELRWIGEALEKGDQLVADIVTGGWCNFSYRIYLEGNPDRQLYAKLAFPRALWDPNPDAHFDIQRIEKEFQMMELYHRLDPGSVAIPYLCLDVDHMKLLVTQWSPSDEQFANQFIDGVVDVRYVVIY